MTAIMSAWNTSQGWGAGDTTATPVGATPSVKEENSADTTAPVLEQKAAADPNATPADGTQGGDEKATG